MKTSIILWLAVLSYIFAAMLAIGFGAVASFAFLFLCAVLMTIFTFRVMQQEEEVKQDAKQQNSSP